MAQRRMFSLKITDTDVFLEMHVSSQLLYFHLNMHADDDGFVSSPRKIMKTICCGEDDLKVLLSKRYVLGFPSGIVVIKHWRMHNLLRKDRYTSTDYIEEKSLLQIKDNGSYTDKQPTDTLLATKRQPPVPVGKVSKGKVRKGKVKKDKLKDYLFLSDSSFKDLWESFVDMRKKMRKPLTDKAISLTMAKFEKWGIDDAKKSLEKTIECGWTGLFEPKKNSNSEQGALNDWQPK